jgi:Ca2+/Na+ antiporter
MATSSPELCISCVGTFMTDDEISIGTIVGSTIFNILAVPACCGLFARSALKLNAPILSRDCLLYAFSIVELIVVIYDHRIMWYEAVLMVFSYVIYLISNQ